MDIIERYRAGKLPLPRSQRAWFLYGVGMENFGRDGCSEEIPVPKCGPRDLLARVDAAGICFSDIKIIKAGGDHPRLFGRNLATDPIIIGHEVALTIVDVGEKMKDQYQVGDRVVVQAEIYYRGKNLAFGYMLPGGFEQYVLLSDEVLRGDDGCYLVPIHNPEIGYAEAALAEPWACVVCSYRWEHRRELKHNGVLWIIGTPGAQERDYDLGSLVETSRPGRVILTDIPTALRDQVADLVSRSGASVSVINGLDGLDPAAVVEQHCGEGGIDDVIVLGGDRPKVIEACATKLARFGILVFVADEPILEPLSIDVGRIHYDGIRILGCPGPDVSKAYSESRHTHLVPHGKLWVVGAGGPMGQMHVQWALEQDKPPALLVASDLDRDRLALVATRFSAAAQSKGTRLVCLNPKELGPEDFDVRLSELAPEGFDDICCLVPVPTIIADCARYLGPRGLLNIFAGVGRGTMADINVTPLAANQALLHGTSGSSIDDLEMTLRLAEAGKLNTNMSVAAICGIDGVRDGLEAVLNQTFPGKTVIYPQVEGLGLVGVDDLSVTLPHMAEKLAPGGVWSREAELELLRKFLPNKYADE